MENQGEAQLFSRCFASGFTIKETGQTGKDTWGDLPPSKSKPETSIVQGPRCELSPPRLEHLGDLTMEPVPKHLRNTGGAAGKGSEEGGRRQHKEQCRSGASHHAITQSDS